MGALGHDKKANSISTGKGPGKTHRSPMNEEVMSPTGGSEPPHSENIPHRTDKAYSTFLPSPVESTGE
jgi:hypothetical protein